MFGFSKITTAFPIVDRELRAAGVGVMPFLARLDPTQLSHEQRTRLQRIRRDLQTHTPDSPDRVALWLLNDEALWRRWLTDGDDSRRQAGTQALAGIHRKTSPTGRAIVAPRREQRMAIRPARP